MKRINKKLISAAVFWILTASVTIFIFLFSAQTGDESAEVSEGLLAFILEHISRFISHNTLRKLAHFTEFAALGFFLAGALYFSFGKNQFQFSLIPCVIYALSDEMHQFFVPERACRITDVFIDSGGSLFGILIFLLILKLITNCKNKKIKSKEKD